MKHLLLAGSALAALAVGPASAAAPPAPVHSWTGCYVGGGGGYGMWNQDSFQESDPLHVQLTNTQTNAGRGWFGTVSGGCDYQVNSNIVVGALADGDWGSLGGTYSSSGSFGVLSQPAGQGGALIGGGSAAGLALQGSETMHSAWYAGARMGWLVTPTVLTYWEGGYTQAHFAQIDISSPRFAPTSAPANIALGGAIAALALDIPAQTYNGWFIGGGIDYALPIFSGLFWRADYRYATYSAVDVPIIVATTGLPVVPGRAVNSQMFVQTVRSELIYRFNWSH